MKQPVIAIIGTGSVGSTLAYTLVTTHSTARIGLFDSDTEKCQGQLEDLKDALSLSQTPHIQPMALQEAGQADIIIITAGVAQKPGQTRFDLLATNKDVMTSLVQGMKPFNKKSIIIVVTNPVDVITRYVQKISGLPEQQVFGSGTFLDTLRLREMLAERLNVHPASIDAYVLGEHGDSQFVAWSTAQVGGVPLASFGLSQKVLDETALQAQQKAYAIIAKKGFTAFGIATCLATYCNALIRDTKIILPVSCFVKDFGLYLSMPAVLGLQGIEKVLHPALHHSEQEKLKASVNMLDSSYCSMGL